ncbi:MAG TPA: hypothetical protein VK069_04630, partial [Mycolicibacillus parakoreensis]|nr:hypothetical protein [Mycolicibacillus parakoreensis]
SVRPEPGSNSPNKTSQKAIQKYLTTNQKTLAKKHHTPNHGAAKGMAKNNNKQKPPNTLLSSQTTHPAPAAQRPPAIGRRT